MAGPARVAWVDHALDTGGAERSLMELLPLLDRDRYAPVLLHSADAVWATSPELAEMPRVPVFGASALLDASRGEVQAGLWASRQQLGAAGGPVRALWRALSACRADIVHTNTLKCSLLASAAVRLPRRRLIWHVRDIITEPAARRWMIAACRAANPYVIAISRAVAEQFEPLSEKLRLRVIYNGVPLDRFSPGAPPAELRPSLGLQADDEVVTVVGRLTPWKGHRTLLRAMAAVTTQHPRARLLVVGQVADREREYLADLETQAAQLGISGVTRFVGYRDDRAKITFGCKREAGFYHIDAEDFELACHRDLFLKVHRATRRLLAIA